jgi:hypothetical protein
MINIKEKYSTLWKLGHNLYRPTGKGRSHDTGGGGGGGGGKFGNEECGSEIDRIEWEALFVQDFILLLSFFSCI